LSVEELTLIEGGKATLDGKEYSSPLVTPIPMEEAFTQATQVNPFYFFPAKAFFTASTVFVAADLIFSAA